MDKTLSGFDHAAVVIKVAVVHRAAFVHRAAVVRTLRVIDVRLDIFGPAIVSLIAAVVRTLDQVVGISRWTFQENLVITRAAVVRKPWIFGAGHSIFDRITVNVEVSGLFGRTSIVLEVALVSISACAFVEVVASFIRFAVLPSVRAAAHSR